jgi:hypothetical protein
VPVGSPATLGDGWRIAVTRVVPNATGLVLAENRFNEPPAPGREFFLVRISATYTGSGSDVLSSYRFRVLGASGVSRASRYKNSCGVTPNVLTYKQVSSGETISGNLCWQVPVFDARTLVMFDDAPFDKERRVWFALQ